MPQAFQARKFFIPKTDPKQEVYKPVPYYFGTLSTQDAADQIAGQVYDLVAGNRRYDIDGLVAYLASDDDSATAETLEDRPENMPVESESTDDTHAETGTDEVSDDEPDVDFGSPERELAAEIVMQEGGTRQEVREHFSDAELDRIARDEMDAETPDDAGTENDVADTADDLSPEDKERIASGGFFNQS